MTKLYFDEALDKAIAVLTTHSETLPSCGVIIIRDLRGVLRMAIEGNGENKSKTEKIAITRLFQAWKDSLTCYSPETEKGTIFWRDAMFDPDAVFDSPDRRKINQTPSIYLLDRQSTGLDWCRQPEPEFPIPVIAFYGLKGGVGRSTALSAHAYWLAEHGKKILVIDLDLESPGVGEILLPHKSRPEFGIVDWLIEDAVGNADDALIRDMTSASPISNKGDVRIVPAYGTKTKDYLPKLARAYLDSTSARGVEHFGIRLRRLVTALIAEYQPDVILIDSRAGLHDIAAATITHLANLALLFATDSRQTWEGYRLLLSHWQSLPSSTLNPIREKLRVVASMIPEEGGGAYADNLLDRSWNTFLNHLYDELNEPLSTGLPQNEGVEYFSFDRNDESGPHYPIPIFRHRAYVEFDPLADTSLLGIDKITPAFGEFVKKISDLAGVNYGDLS